MSVPPTFDAEREVDLGRLWGSIVARWWLVLAGLIAGIVLGFLLSLGSTTVFRAATTVYLGQPFSPSGSSPIQSLNSNPRFVSEAVRSEFALKEAARKSGLHVGDLRGKVTSQAITGVAAAKISGAPLVSISVTGHAPVKIERAANALAAIVIRDLTPYVATKIKGLRSQLEGEQEQLDSVNKRIATLNAVLRTSKGISQLDQLLLLTQADNSEQRRGQLLEAESARGQQISLATNVEAAHVVTPATAAPTTARSRRNSVLVGGLIGVLVGIVAALVWAPLSGRLAGRSAV
ncbi:MAG: Wzz/FepE/Etk N-terminal domain-containing protein [Gaiellaceae bacterium]